MMTFYSPKFTDLFKRNLPGRPQLHIVKMAPRRQPFYALPKTAMVIVTVSVLAGMILYYWR